MAGIEPAAVPEQHRPVIRWTAQRLLMHRDTISSWPMTLRAQVPGLGRVLFCHATPRNENECFTQLTTEERLLPIFDAADADVVVCGHTHMQFDRIIGRTRVVNAGSIGMPFGKPGADWALLGPDIQLRHSSYDLANAAAEIRSTDYPDAEEFAMRYVLNPPSEQQMLDAFSHAELKGA
jgi:diadenosine tetraphosphatase ApaH/serine/threonine PP2A family protein phosphatase